ncbi:carbohydrate binding family 9 domain-containing protein [Sandaracinus amylolyticus]|uniref:carbohydrate binding family 9 domain-containing protein n=1 Tax=Sandaracinus amylolyticus TaxID=927083 RepID=UPI001F2A5334|nr:carbohydrate binding family 9 domain-containing protein [Sandaracinus amylolyticus]UJR82447.1 Hypothetical protein I5071_45120 [Sandaracinus amylolyticus]
MRAFVVVLAILFALPALARADEPPRVRAAARGETPIDVDGALDEDAWSRAEIASGFTERTPHPGAPAPVGTRFRVLYDASALYVGIELDLAEGESPRALSMTRDSEDIWNDDAISVKIDARRDHRTTLGFVVSASGAQLDYLVLDNGRAFRREVDMVWQSAVRVHEDRWIVELRIPAISLGLADAEGPRAIGINLSRDHNARAATYDWAPMSPEFGSFSALHYGVVEGVEIGGAGAPLAVTLYSLGAYESPESGDPADAFRGAIGADALMRIDGDVWAEATVLTDFAQVDLDDALVNLDRFPLFFPERRPFFLNGLDVFDAGVPETLVPFYSRRIGLDPAGDPIPVLGGLKLYGRAGPVSFGVIDVLTDDEGDVPAANHTAARGRFALDEGASYVGAFVVSRQPFRWDGGPLDRGPSVTYGGDALVRAADDRLELYGFASGTALDGQLETGREGEGFASAASARWRGEVWQPVLSGLYVDHDYTPELGFARRPGAARLTFESPVIARPSGFFRRMQIGPRLELQASDDFGRALYGSGGVVAEVEGDAGWIASFVADYREDVVDEDFEIVPGVTARAGTWRGVYLEAYVASPSARNPYVELYYSVSNAYFGGVLHNPYARFAASLGPFVRIDLQADVYYVMLREHDPFWTYALNALLRVTPTTALQIDLIGRVDGENERATGLLRVRWRYAPGSDLFVVWRENVDWDATNVVVEHEVTLKMTYRFDLSL